MPAEDANVNHSILVIAPCYQLSKRWASDVVVISKTPHQSLKRD